MTVFAATLTISSRTGAPWNLRFLLMDGGRLRVRLGLCGFPQVASVRDVVTLTGYAVIVCDGL